MSNDILDELPSDTEKLRIERQQAWTRMWLGVMAMVFCAGLPSLIMLNYSPRGFEDAYGLPDASAEVIVILLFVSTLIPLIWTLIQLVRWWRLFKY